MFTCRFRITSLTNCSVLRVELKKKREEKKKMKSFCIPYKIHIYQSSPVVQGLASSVTPMSRLISQAIP